MPDNLKVGFLALAIIFLTPLALILLYVGIGIGVDLLSREQNEIVAILGTELPKSAKEVDHYSTSGWDGVSGQLCAEISKPDFLNIIQELRVKGELMTEKISSKDIFASSLSFKRGLHCWNPTASDNENMYFFITPGRDRLYIKYENGKVFVVRDSA
jgi:hypothetical protein